jgi:nitroimidazol reductase NimA-like FMN-containing flavoprotein (pyridoxamine 5'-phosphate oxidase superfamily)
VTEPTTTLDSQFSDPSATATTWDDARRILERAELFWIATVRTDGRPHMTPLVAVWLDDMLHFCTGETEQKAVNLRGNQNVILLTGCNQWDDGVDVVLEGRAARVVDRRTLERLAEAWSHKWNGDWNYEPGSEGFEDSEGNPIFVFAVRPDKAFAFGKGRFSHTRYAF